MINNKIIKNVIANAIWHRPARIIVHNKNYQSYPSIDSMWEHQINCKAQANGTLNNDKAQIVNPIGSSQNWYNNAHKYWSTAQSTYDGVLSGYGSLSQIDIEGSLKFIKSYLKTKTSSTSFLPNRVLDCGAGIGRIAKQMLCSLFKTVDVVDQCNNFIEKSKQILKNNNIGHFYVKGLQQFNFQQKYDCIWIQWVLSQLTDKDAVQFLKKAKQSLNEEGFIVVKQNQSEHQFLVDKSDCSVARSSQMYKKIFKNANLRIFKQQYQQNWPKELLDVKMYLLY